LPVFQAIGRSLVVVNRPAVGVPRPRVGCLGAADFSGAAPAGRSFPRPAARASPHTQLDTGSAGRRMPGERGEQGTVWTSPGIVPHTRPGTQRQEAEQDIEHEET
jgi:hypothetical protein